MIGLTRAMCPLGHWRDHGQPGGYPLGEVPPRTLPVEHAGVNGDPTRFYCRVCGTRWDRVDLVRGVKRCLRGHEAPCRATPALVGGHHAR